MNSKLKVARKLSAVLIIVVAIFSSVTTIHDVKADEYYTIQAGDNLWTIADQFGVYVEDLIAINGIEDPSLIITGDVLLIPTGSYSEQSTSSSFIHVVEWGDNLPYIAELYDVDLYELAELNWLPYPWTIYPEQQLVIPGYVAYSDESYPAMGGGQPVYVVEEGDNLPDIAATFGVDLLGLANANNLEHPWLIFPGDNLVIPGGWPVESQETPDQWGDVHPAYMPTPDIWDVRYMLVEAANMYGWDPYLIMSLAWTESRWRQDVVSWADAYGVLQLLLDTAEWTGSAIVGRDVDVIYNTWDNIETGVAYLTHLRSLTDSDYLALAAYFQGLYSVETDGVFDITDEYALNIIQMRDLFAAGSLP